MELKLMDEDRNGVIINGILFLNIFLRVFFSFLDHRFQAF